MAMCRLHSPFPPHPSLCSVIPGTALPEQKEKALHQQLSELQEVKRKLYSSPYTYHLLDMERTTAGCRITIMLAIRLWRKKERWLP